MVPIDLDVLGGAFAEGFDRSLWRRVEEDDACGVWIDLPAGARDKDMDVDVGAVLDRRVSRERIWAAGGDRSIGSGEDDPVLLVGMYASVDDAGPDAVPVNCCVCGGVSSVGVEGPAYLDAVDRV